MSRKFQFSLKTLIVSIMVISAFLGGMALQRRLDKPIMGTKPLIGRNGLTHIHTFIELPDGSRWWDHDPNED